MIRYPFSNFGFEEFPPHLYTAQPGIVWVSVIKGHTKLNNMIHVNSYINLELVSYTSYSYTLYTDILEVNIM